MTYFNPLAGTPLQGGQVQEQLAAAKARQVRRAQTLARNVAAEGDTFEHQVESAEDLSDIRDGQNSGGQPDPRGRRDDEQDPPAGDDDHPRLDVKA